MELSYTIFLGVVAAVLAAVFLGVVGWVYAALVEWRWPLDLRCRFGGPPGSKGLILRDQGGDFSLFFDVRNRTRDFLTVRFYPRGAGYEIEGRPIHEIGSERTFALQDLRLDPREYRSLFLRLKTPHSVSRFAVHVEVERYGYRWPAMVESDTVDLLVG
jgi:hypothetical protein